MFNSITNVHDGFYRHHNAKPSVRRSVLFYQFLPSFCPGEPAIRAAAKTRKSQYLDCFTRQLFISLALQPPVGTCQPVCCLVHPHCQSNPSFVMSENLQDLHQQVVPSHLLESPCCIPQSSSISERTAGVSPGASIFSSFCSPRSII